MNAPTMRKMRFTVGEIEHSGDLDAAIAVLREAGCRNIRVLPIAYGDDPDTRCFEADVPDGVDPRSL